MDPLPCCTLPRSCFLALSLTCCCFQNALGADGIRMRAMDTVISVNTEKLSSLLNIDLPFAPVVGFHKGPFSKIHENVQVIGTLKDEVWMSNIDNTLISLTKLGRLVPGSDTRLDTYENTLVDAKVIVAYEKKRSIAKD